MAGLPSKAALQRIAVTVPPADWLHGILRAYHDFYRQALNDLGVSTIDVPLQTFLDGEAGPIADLLSDLRAFRPRAAMGINVGAWLPFCRLPPQRDGWAPNVFSEVLDIPSICLWDGPPLDFAAHLLRVFGPGSNGLPTLATSRPGALAALRRELRHPRLIHWSRDSGQARVMRELGCLSAGRVLTDASPVLPGFSPEPDTSPVEQAVFLGHLNDHPRPWSDAYLATLSNEIVEESLCDLDQPIWDILLRRTASRPELDPDQTLFWGFANRTIVHEAQAAHRRAILEHVGVKRIEGYVPLGPLLARTFARHAITVDVLNPSFISGFGHKPVLGFAAGGFVLLNRKRDFVDTFGDAGEAVSYSSADELAAKIDLYLTRPALRREIGGAIREKLFARHTLQATLVRILEQASAEIEQRSSWSVPAQPKSVPILDLLPQLRRWSKWPWRPHRVQHRRDGVLVSCHAEDWGYAAHTELPRQIAGLNEPHLLVTLTTQAGRIGVGLVRDPSAPPILEQMVGPSRAPVGITLELPHDPSVQALIRKTSDEPARALVTRLVLCDRR
ncbi:MAG TPA: glycosyltransferase [Reyranella sp.]